MYISISNETFKKEKKLIELSYQLSEEEQEETTRIARDFQYAENVKNTPTRLLNDLTVVERERKDLETLNCYVAPKNTDENYWRSKAKKTTTREKVIKIFAKILNKILVPSVIAYDSENDENQSAGEVMARLLDWVIDNSDYTDVFFRAVFISGYSPISYIMHEYVNGKFVFKNIPLAEIFIANEFIKNIQEQPFVFRKRKIDFITAKQKWGKKDNFKYVKAGTVLLFNDTTNKYYASAESLKEARLVEEIIYWNKDEKLIYVYLNGVLIEKKPMKGDKYPFATLGYELIDGQYFYYKSFVNKLSPNQNILDEMYRLALDGTLLNNMPPTALYGSEVVDSGVVVPAGVVPLRDPNSKLEAFLPKGDLNATWGAIQKIEEDMQRDAQADFTVDRPNITAYQTAVLEEQAQIQLGFFGHMITNFVKDLGELVLENIIKHLTVGELMEIDGKNVLKYQKFLVSDAENNKKIKVEFEVPEQEEISREEKLLKSLKLLMEEKIKNQKIYKVNPKFFRELKYKLRVGVDALYSPSGKMMKALNLEGYERMVNNPLIVNDMESLYNVTRDLLVAQYKPNSVDKYVPSISKISNIQNQASQQASQQVEQQVEQQQPQTQKIKQGSLNKSISALVK
jgi:hypothetical protein